MRSFLILLLVISTQVGASSLRIDVGVYRATGLCCDSSSKFDTMFDADGDAYLQSTYQKFTYDTSISKKTSMSTYITLTSIEMVGFDAFEANDGQSTTGISAVGTKFETQWWKNKNSYLNLTYGFQAPGDNNTPYSFLSIHDGVPRYSLGASYGIGWFGSYLNYVYRPGKVDKHNANATQGSLGGTDVKTLDIPDLIEYGISYMHLVRRNIFFGSLDAFQAQGGIGIGDTANGWSDTHRPFNATKESKTTFSVGWGYYFSSTRSVDLIFSTVVQGKNTDTGEAVQLGYKFPL